MAKLTKTLTQMGQSGMPAICSLTRMFECVEDSLFEKKRKEKIIPEWMLLKFELDMMTFFCSQSKLDTWNEIYVTLVLRRERGALKASK